MKIKHVLLAFCLCLGYMASAQKFAPAFEGFSHQKPTYITMKDGTEKEVVVKQLFFKRGLIDQLKVVDSDGNKVKLNPEEIDYMYIPPSDLAKFIQTVDAATNLTKLQDGELSEEHLKDGYLYMESCSVQINKNKTQYCMLQVRNPTFSKKVKVYHDPFAQETSSVNVGGFTVAGGDDKSYYIKKEGEDMARRITKKDYRKNMEELFPECPAVLEKYGAKPVWAHFEQFIYDYSTMCE